MYLNQKSNAFFSHSHFFLQLRISYPTRTYILTSTRYIQQHKSINYHLNF